MKQFITTAEAARRLKVDPSRIRQMIIEKELSAVDIDGRTKLIETAVFSAFEKEWKAKRKEKKKPGPRSKKGREL